MNVVFCELKNPEHKLPMPDRGMRFFGKDGEWVNTAHPFYRLCLDQGDIVKNVTKGREIQKNQLASKKAKPSKSTKKEDES